MIDLRIRAATRRALAFKNSRLQSEARVADAKARWDSRFKYSYQIGGTVCTKDNNYFGNIDRIDTSRYKIHVIGRAAGFDGYFFSAVGEKFDYERLDVPRWYNLGEFGPCTFHP